MLLVSGIPGLCGLFDSGQTRPKLLAPKRETAQNYLVCGKRHGLHALRQLSHDSSIQALSLRGYVLAITLSRTSLSTACAVGVSFQAVPCPIPPRRVLCNFEGWRKPARQVRRSPARALFVRRTGLGEFPGGPPPYLPRGSLFSG